MKIKNLVVIVVLVLIVLQLNLASSHSGHETLDFKSIINAKVPCDKLNETYLEAIGDYFMQLMHPNNHEQMEEMMCNNDENCLKEMHINMAYRFYCNQIDNTNYYKQKLFWGYSIITLSILILLILTAIIIYFILKNKNKMKKINKIKIRKQMKEEKVLKLIIGIVLVLFTLPALATSLFMTSYGFGFCPMCSMGMGFMGFGFGIFWVIALIALLILGVYLIVKGIK